MKTKVNICTEDWCNIVFEGKNKEYGAFAIRTHAAQQKAKSLFITILLASSIAIFPLLKKKIIPELTIISNITPVTLTEVNIEPPKLPEIKAPELPQIPKPTIKFSIPVITNEKVTEEIATISELLQTKEVISTETKKGEPNGITPETHTTPPIEDNTIREFVEKMPQFEGGPEELRKYLSKNMHYPSAAIENQISGRVYVQFVVDKNGEISNIKVLRGLEGGCNEEAIRVVKRMPKWKPGMQNGNPVAVYFTLPIIFSISH